MHDTRERLLRTGERLFRQQGYAGTGLKQLAKEADAPWSSMYHFFPGGKEELATEVLRYAAEHYAAMIAKAFDAFTDPADAIAAMFKGEAKILTESKFRNGCPVAGVTLDVASTVEALRAPCATAFGLWVATIARGLAKGGLAEKDAQALASYVLSSLEGAIVLSRAAKSTAPLEATGAFVVRTVRARLAER
ncbi:MAG: TetR/AcrR family transcriptional regulator [Alphaproteobacteria bacterium]|nr:TetR/AcrR family transcriptional regulator [Alphaproteobacteria bacterium]